MAANCPEIPHNARLTFAKAANATITALYAKPTGNRNRRTMAIWWSPPCSRRWFRGREGKAKEYLGFIKKLCKDAGVECTALAVVSETPWEAIVNAAEDHNCDLIFMSKHGRGGLSSLLLGSETYRVLTHSSVPVLVYRPPEVDASRRKAKEKARKRTGKEPDPDPLSGTPRLMWKSHQRLTNLP
jgi:nucleotide-binding universal stress UspA family protein